MSRAVPDFVAAIASLSVPPIARSDNASWSSKGCSWRPPSGSDCAPSSNGSARQRLRKLIHRAHGEEVIMRFIAKRS